MVRIGILWPEIGILRRAGDGHALEVSSACRVGLALDAIRRRGRSRWGMSPLVGEAVGGSVPGVLWAALALLAGPGSPALLSVGGDGAVGGCLPCRRDLWG